MKAILSLIISGALVVSGFGQTRNVLVGTNNTVVQPTNFWSADASNARTGLGLGTAATNPASAFQPASSALTNLVSGNGGALTNLQATNLVGLIPTSNIPSILLTNIGTITIAQGGTGATNAANARQNLGSTTVGDALFIATNVAAARTAIGATTIGSSVFTLANPSAITFLRLNADNTASALTASDFRTALSLGTAATNPSSVFQPSSAVLSNLASSNAVNLTNLQATNLVGVIPSSNIPSTTLTNISGTLAIVSGGTGATNASNARVNLGATTVGDNLFTATNAESARTAIGALATNGDATNLTNFPASLLRTNGNGAGLTNLTAANITGTVALASNVTGTIAITNGGTGATNAGGARTNLGLGSTNVVTFDTVGVSKITSGGGAPTHTLDMFSASLNALTNPIITWSIDDVYFSVPLFFSSTTNAAITRTNLGLGWSALTNTTASGFQASLFGANTNPVLVNTNGEVVSPTNFWQVAPIVAQFIESQPTTNSTTNIVGARLLHIHSLATNIVNVTNTIALPTNGTSFAGDIALVVHQGPTNSMTRVRQAGSTNNLITMTRFDEAVELVYYENEWQLNHNIAFVEPIYFAGTNASANAAASRTNLGLGQFKDAVGDNWAELYDNGELRLQAGNTIIFYESFDFGGTNAADFREQSRISLGLGATNNVTFSNVTASGTLTATSTVTAKTNLIVEGRLDFTTNATNSNPATNNQIQDFIEIRVGTNQFWLPLYK